MAGAFSLPAGRPGILCVSPVFGPGSHRDARRIRSRNSGKAANARSRGPAIAGHSSRRRSERSCVSNRSCASVCPRSRRSSHGRRRTRRARSSQGQAKESNSTRLRRKGRQRQALLWPPEALVRLSQGNRSPSRRKSGSLSLRVLQDSLHARSLAAAPQLHCALLSASHVSVSDMSVLSFGFVLIFDFCF